VPEPKNYAKNSGEVSLLLFWKALIVKINVITTFSARNSINFVQAVAPPPSLIEENRFGFYNVLGQKEGIVDHHEKLTIEYEAFWGGLRSCQIFLELFLYMIKA
jgi:hypothetical protein